MSEHALWKIHIDGAARGNPGPAAYAFVLSPEGSPPIEESGCLGSATNNVAEYTGLIKALERAAEVGANRLLVHSDSELLVKQMNGEYRVKNEALRSLYDEARKLLHNFDEVTIMHVRREQNKRADELCNIALDGGKPSAAPRTKSKASTPAPARAAAVREDAIDCLRSAAAAWARGKPNDPDPAAVWEQLWSILEENGIIKPPK
jgi:ribonuclease HI